MERVTPIDLESARFPLVRKGYDTNAVDAMLKAAAGELEAVNQELRTLRQSHETDMKELELFRIKQATLADALMLAQKTADETRASAHKEADLIVEQATQKAADVRRSAQDELGDIVQKIEQRMQDKKEFEARFSALLNSYDRLLQDAPQLRLEGQASDAESAVAKGADQKAA